jgi:hypothetical protein
VAVRQTMIRSLKQRIRLEGGPNDERTVSVAIPTVVSVDRIVDSEQCHTRLSWDEIALGVVTIGTNLIVVIPPTVISHGLLRTTEDMIDQSLESAIFNTQIASGALLARVQTKQETHQIENPKESDHQNETERRVKRDKRGGEDDKGRLTCKYSSSVAEIEGQRS